jgi:hypothetical protein
VSPDGHRHRRRPCRGKLTKLHGVTAIDPNYVEVVASMDSGNNPV